MWKGVGIHSERYISWLDVISLHTKDLPKEVTCSVATKSILARLYTNLFDYASSLSKMKKARSHFLIYE